MASFGAVEFFMVRFLQCVEDCACMSFAIGLCGFEVGAVALFHFGHHVFM